jgi:P-loop containing NTP hydrolase pore-1
MTIVSAPAAANAPLLASLAPRVTCRMSKSDKPIEDAQRDWSALGMERLLITPLARFRQGNSIRLEQGILFTTYATLRTDARDERVSRVQQIVDWLGSDFDGVLVFDESQSLANAARGKGEPAPARPLPAGGRLEGRHGHPRPGAQPSHELQDGLRVRRAKVMSLFQVELCGFTEGMVDRLKALGLISEITTWKLRLFVPTSEAGPTILAELMDRYPLVQIADRSA